MAKLNKCIWHNSLKSPKHIFWNMLGLAIYHVTQHGASMTRKEHRKHLQSPPPAMAAAQVSEMDGEGGWTVRLGSCGANGGSSFNWFIIGFVTLLRVWFFVHYGTLLGVFACIF